MGNMLEWMQHCNVLYCRACSDKLCSSRAVSASLLRSTSDLHVCAAEYAAVHSVPLEYCTVVRCGVPLGIPNVPRFCRQLMPPHRLHKRFIVK